MTPTSVAQLIETTTAATKACPGWAGSDAHLDVLEQYLKDRASSITEVRWHQHESFWDRKSGIVFLERPGGGVSLLEDVSRCALNAFHESLHARYSTDPKVTAFFVELDNLDNAGNETGALLRGIFNQLEDERVMRAEAQTATDDLGEMNDFRDKIFEDHFEDYRNRHAEELWTANPADPIDQFTVTLTVLIHGSTLHELHPRVRTLLNDCEPVIDHAVQGMMMEAVASTYDIVQLYQAALPDLV